MSDAAPAKAPAKSPTKAPAKKAAKPKMPAKPAEHPKYVMIAAAVGTLKERGGSSRQAILKQLYSVFGDLKYIMANYKVGSEVTKINARVKTALKAGVKAGTLKQAKGTGASGSFRLGEKKVTAKPQTAKKPKAAAKKPKSPKKTAAKKAKSPKKTAAKKDKSPKKAAAKPKKAKTPAKKAAKSPAKPKKMKTPKKPAAKKAAKK